MRPLSLTLFIFLCLLAPLWAMPPHLCVAPSNFLIKATYATPHNFTGKIVPGYQAHAVWLNCDALKSLEKLNEELKSQNKKIVLFDGYRPKQAVRAFWAWAQNSEQNHSKAEYYPNLSKKELFEQSYIALESSHSTGYTIDLGLATLNNELLDFGTPFDFLDPASHHGSFKVNSTQRALRLFLRQKMEASGFKAYYREWWHYQWKKTPKGCPRYDIPIQRSASLADSILQLMVVQSAHWNSALGVLSLWERKSAQSVWKQRGQKYSVNLGLKGMAWGLGESIPNFEGYQNSNSPMKREGDLRSPAGLFQLGPLWHSKPNLVFQWPSVSIDSKWCVDDTLSEYYNQIQDSIFLKSQHSPLLSSEKLIQYAQKDSIYQLGLWIAQNPQNIAGRGSCVYLHIGRGKGKGTQGCTSLDRPSLLSILKWLKKEHHPHLLQLPQSEMNSLFPELIQSQ